MSFLSEFEVAGVSRQAVAPFEARVGPLVTTADHLTGSTDMRRVQEQVRHYTYWNYVAIKRILDRASGQLPNIGRVIRGGTAGRQRHLSGPQRRWIQQHYHGYLQSALDDLEPVPQTHPLSQLLWHVNPEDTWSEFLAETLLFLNLTGRFYWWAIPNGLRSALPGINLPAQLWVIPTQWVSEFRTKSGQMRFYRVVPDGDMGRKEDIPPQDVIKGKWTSPMSKTMGHSPLSAAPMWVDNVESIEKSRWHSFRNGANPDWLVMLNESYAHPTEEVIDKIKQKFLQRSSGTHRAGEPIVVPPGVTLQPATNKPREMDYGTSGDATRDQSLALHGTPKTVAGITTDVNRATVEGANLIFCEVTINPQLRLVAGVLTEKLAPRYGADIRCWFDDCTPRDAVQELAEARFDAEIGALDPDERRIDRGREPKGEPAYQTGYLPAGKIPLSLAAREELEPEPEPEPPPEDDPDSAEDDESRGDAEDSKQSRRAGDLPDDIFSFSGPAAD